MAGRKWNNNSLAKQIVESARSRAETARQTPLSDHLDLLTRLPSLDDIELQSLAVRLGGYAWKRRLYRDDLAEVSLALLQASASTPLSTSQKAFVDVMDNVVKALLYGDDNVVPWGEPWQVEQRARDIWRTPEEDRSVIDAAFVRSLLEPLLAGDRSVFRSLLGTISKELMEIGARGVDGRLPNVTSLLGYQELKFLQGALNGILQASRATAKVPGQVTRRASPAG